MRRVLGVLVVAVAWGVLTAAGATAAVSPLSRASGTTPFAPGCNGVPQNPMGTVDLNAEVEPYVAASPTNRGALIGVWQQDRWSNGGSNGLLTGVSTDSGRSWTRPVPPPFSRCAGGTAANGGNYERASDPWVTFAPNGSAYQIALALNDPQGTLPTSPSTGVLISKSTNGGLAWGKVRTLIRDTSAQFLNDKESITADPTNSNRVFAIWDRLDFGANSGPTYFSRTTNGGATWSQARAIYEPGPGSQTIGNQIVVLPNGTLVNVFDLLLRGTTNVAVQRSTDHGLTWSPPTVIDQLLNVPVVDPRDGALVRTGDIVPEVAVDPRPGTHNLYVVWQDGRFTGFSSDQIAFSKSSDGGLTWTSATQVSENPDTQAFTPQVHVDGGGNIAITYYDFTFDTTASPTLDTDYWIARSDDGGDAFHPRERLTPTSFDMRTAPFSTGRGFFVGDYEGLRSIGAAFDPFFVQANNGNVANRTDVFSALVTAPFPLSSTRHALQPGRGSLPTSHATPGRLPGGPKLVSIP